MHSRTIHLHAVGPWLCLAALAVLFSPLPAAAETMGLGMNPGRIEVELPPNNERTVSFEIESPPSEKPVRGRLLLSLTDWTIREDGSMSFFEPGTQPMSAVPWITFSPVALSISSGQKQMVRVTVNTPAEAKPGLYRAGVFVQERPPATPPKTGEHIVVFRFRYLVTLYVIVPPVTVRPALAAVGLEPTASGLRLLCRMKNDGSRHVRPLVSWSLQDESRRVLAEVKRFEATVLLPFQTLEEKFPVDRLAPGRYELSAEVDFQNGGPVQSMTRTVEIAPMVAGVEPVRKP